MEIDILLKYFDLLTMFFFFYPKSFVLCAKIGLPLEYIVLATFYIIIPEYYRIHDNK